MKWVSNIKHQHHNPKSLDKSLTIGQSQLTETMIKEINKLLKCNISSAIQQNVLMSNKDVTVAIMTAIEMAFP